MHKTLTVKKLETAARKGNVGFCKLCGTKHTGVEPDAANYECKKCHMHAVYGAEELFIYVSF